MKRLTGPAKSCQCSTAEHLKLESVKLDAVYWKYMDAIMGMLLKRGTIVDSTIISAPSSTKNKEKKRDPDAHQVRKGNTWHFGYKAHIGADKDSGLVHTIAVTAANVHDVSQDRVSADRRGRIRLR